MFPRAVDLEITDRCNQRCYHCNRIPAPPNLGSVLETERLFTLIEELYEIGVAQLMLTGGEPGCRKDWLDVVVNACNKAGLRVVVVTNGTRWDEKEIYRLAFLREPPKITISLDGWTPETYGVLRRTIYGLSASDMFHQVVYTAKKVVETGLDLCINIVVTDQTAKHLLKTIQFAGELGASSILLLRFLNIGSNQSSGIHIEHKSWRKILCTVTERKLAGEFYYDRVSVSTACLWDLVLPLLESGMSLQEILILWPTLTVRTRKQLLRGIFCSAGLEYCSIDAFGNVYPCAVASIGHKDMIAGNVRDHNFKTIWTQSTLLKTFRSLSAKSLDHNGCGKCPELSWCGGGCRIRALIGNNSLGAADAACPLAVKRSKNALSSIRRST